MLTYLNDKDRVEVRPFSRETQLMTQKSHSDSSAKLVEGG